MDLDALEIVRQRLQTGHGVIAGPELRALLTRAEIRTALARGFLLRAHRDVFVDGAMPPTVGQRLAAATMATRGVASHRSAAALWGMINSAPLTPEVTVTADRRPTLRYITIHRSRFLRDEFVTTIDNIPVTTAAFTLVQLGAVTDVRTVSDALDRAVVDGHTTVDDVAKLHRHLARSGRDGSTVLGTVLDSLLAGQAVVAGADSVFEARMARLLRGAGIAAQHHYLVRDRDGEVVAEVDFAVPSVRLAIEVDGYSAHGTPSALAADLTRQNRIVKLGWRVLRFTWRQVMAHPDQVIAEIVQALRRLVVDIRPPAS